MHSHVDYEMNKKSPRNNHGPACAREEQALIDRQAV